MKQLAVPSIISPLAFILISLLVPPLVRADDAAEIRAAQNSIAAGAEARDLDKIMSNYWHSPELFVFDVYPPRQYVGWNAFRKDWRDFLAVYKGPITYQMQDMFVDTDGKLGYVHVIEHIAGTTNAGKRDVINMRITEVYKKIEGKWQIVHEHASVPVDLTTRRADILSK
jgi:ketosteroid isomerase-like protein